MKLNLDQPLLGYDAAPLQDGEVTLTLKAVSLTALRTGIPTDKDLAPMAKYELGAMGAAIGKGLDLTAEQVAALKDRIGKVFLSPELVHAAWTAIEGEQQGATPA